MSALPQTQAQTQAIKRIFSDDYQARLKEYDLLGILFNKSPKM